MWPWIVGIGVLVALARRGSGASVAPPSPVPGPQTAALPPVKATPKMGRKMRGALAPSGKAYIAPGGCVYVQVSTDYQPKTTRLSVPYTDGTTQALPGWWAPAPGQDLSACYVEATPQSAIARVMGALQSTIPLVSGAISGTVGDVRTALNREWPQLAPLLQLAEQWAGIDVVAQAGALLQGAEQAGLPIGDVSELLTAPQEKLQALAASAKEAIQAQAGSVIP